MKSSIGALGLAAALTVAGCEDKGKEVTSSPDAGQDKTVQTVADGAKAKAKEAIQGVVDSGSKPVESQEVPPPKIIIPAAPKGETFRLVTIQIIGTTDTSWVPKGYLAVPMVSTNNPSAPPFGLMVSSPSLASVELTPPAGTEEIGVTAGKFHTRWSKHPDQPTHLPFAQEEEEKKE